MGVVCGVTHTLSFNAIYRTLKPKHILIPSMHCCHLEVLSLSNSNFNFVSMEMCSVGRSQSCLINMDQDVTHSVTVVFYAQGHSWIYHCHILVLWDWFDSNVYIEYWSVSFVSSHPVTLPHMGVCLWHILTNVPFPDIF